MKSSELKRLTNQAASFMDFIKLKNRPQLHFIKRSGLSEYKINEAGQQQNALVFNVLFFKGMTPEYILLIVLHEIYHFSKQGIKTYNEVTFIRDSNHWELMQICDIEADVQVAMFMYEECLIQDFNSYLKAYYSGVNVFRDAKIRKPKLERFMGCMISIYMVFNDNKKVLILPQLTYDETLVIGIDFGSLNVIYNSLTISVEEMRLWKMVYQDAATIGLEDFTAHVIHLNRTFIANLQNNITYAS